MAIIRSEIQENQSSGPDTRSTYDCIVETISDLSEEQTKNMGIGSMAYVMDDQSIHIRQSDNTWS